MQQIKTTASKINGVADIAFYSLPNSEFLLHVKSNPQTLYGWGAMSWQELAKYISQYIGVNANVILKGMRKVG